MRECPGRFEGQSCKIECPERMGTSENLGACLRGQNRLEIRGVAPLSSVSRLSLARSRYARPVAVPGRVKLGDLRVSEDEIRILSFHVQLQRAFARWRIMEPFANSHAREITAGHVDRAAAMCQSGERRSLNSVRRPEEIDSPRPWQVFREQVENSRKAEWRPAANWAKGPSWVALDRRHERSAERLP